MRNIHQFMTFHQFLYIISTASRTDAILLSCNDLHVLYIGETIVITPQMRTNTDIPDRLSNIAIYCC